MCININIEIILVIDLEKWGTTYICVYVYTHTDISPGIRIWCKE